MFKGLVYSLVLSAADREPPSQHAFLSLQASAMEHAVGLERMQKDSHCIVTDLKNPQKILFEEVAGDVRGICQWPGVECDSESIVRSIDWMSIWPQITLPCISLRWIPQTVRRLFMKSQLPARKDRFEARFLPRESLQIEITQCGFAGNLVIEDLPAGLTDLDVRHNSLCGTVVLVHLPPCLKIMRLDWNPIDTIIIDNERLPESLKCVRFIHRRKIRQVETHGRKVDTRIAVDRIRTKRGMM